ncbi:unnamed protein product [Eruca vesicaria subsp. sativa]|uniref:Uncharacterized protein n=1 Tax=Eruca vesicaria subsp. sativa TaxID=29727 RepID=A0ABC8JQZ4_ERUVS|nr:unnamed protein product [Eruca vesicaria subsp. sativa]
MASLRSQDVENLARRIRISREARRRSGCVVPLGAWGGGGLDLVSDPDFGCEISLLPLAFSACSSRLGEWIRLVEASWVPFDGGAAVLLPLVSVVSGGVLLGRSIFLSGAFFEWLSVPSRNGLRRVLRRGGFPMSNPWASVRLASALIPPSLAAGNPSAEPNLVPPLPPDPPDPSRNLSLTHYPPLSPPSSHTSATARTVAPVVTVRSKQTSSTTDIEMLSILENSLSFHRNIAPLS